MKALPPSSNEKVLLRTEKFVVASVTVDGISKPVIQHPGAVVILPLVDESHICLIENHRHSVQQSLIELPAGTLEPDEPPMEAAIRELSEETGFRATSLTSLCQFFVSPGIMNEQMHAFVATDLQPGEQNLMEDESITTLIVEYQQAIDWVRTGKICDGKSIALLMYYNSFGKL